MSDKTENCNVFDLATNDIDADYELGMPANNGGDFYLEIYYSCFLDGIKSDDKKSLLRSVMALKKAGYKELVENRVAGTETSYINLAKELIRENVDLRSSNLFRHLNNQEIFNYIDFICYIHSAVKDSAKFKKILPTLLLLKDCELQKSLEILELLTMLIDNEKDWSEKIDFKSMANRLLFRETTSSIVYLTSLLSDKSKGADTADIFSYFVKLVDSYKGDDKEILDLFVDSVKGVFEDDLALDCYFDALSLKIDEPNYYNEEWLRMFFNIVPVVLNNVKELENKDDRERCYGNLKKVFKYDNYFAILASMHFTFEELNERYLDSLDIERKIHTAPLSETYFEYVEPIRDTDYEEEIDLETIYEMHKEKSNYDVAFEQVINQLVNKEDFNKKVKVYVVPKKNIKVLC